MNEEEEYLKDRKRSINPAYQLNSRQFYIFWQQFFYILHRFALW